METRVSLKGLEDKEDDLNLEFRVLNMEKTIKDYGIGLQLLPRRDLPLVTSWRPSWICIHEFGMPRRDAPTITS